MNACQPGISHVIYSWVGCYSLNCNILSLSSAVLRWVTGWCHESSLACPHMCTHQHWMLKFQGQLFQSQCYALCAYYCAILPGCPPYSFAGIQSESKVPICNLAGHNYHGHCNNQFQIQRQGTCWTVSVCVGVRW